MIKATRLYPIISAEMNGDGYVPVIGAAMARLGKVSLYES